MSELRSSVAESFSLTQGGPFYRLQVKFGHAQNERARVFNRALVGMIVAWLPLLVLSIVQGTAYGKQVQIPFLAISRYIRFLVALPILILAESLQTVRDNQFHGL